MPGIRTAIARRIVKHYMSGWAEGTIAEQRARTAAAVRLIPRNRRVRIEPFSFQHLSGLWVVPQNHAGTEPHSGILYLHGGAFALGSADVSRDLVSRLALATRRPVLALDYRLAPEHPFPAALEDCTAAWNWLVSTGWRPESSCIAGDSAGGNLALATALDLRDASGPLPGAVLAFSPWLDLTLSGASVQRRAAVDPFLKGDTLERFADSYCGGYPKDHPLVSPLCADLQGLPPVLLQCGRDEILLDDVRRFTRRARTSGVQVRMEIYSGLFHVFQLLSFLPETRQAMRSAADFFREVLPAGRDSFSNNCLSEEKRHKMVYE